MVYTRLTICFLSLFLGSCASQVPVLLTHTPEPNHTFQQVKENTAAFQQQHVRWGGKIISVENKENTTWVEILANPLNGYGRPITKDTYQGRFIAKIDGFLDPELYNKDRKLSIYGTIDTELVRRIDDHPYSYPLVSAEVFYLWPKDREAQDYYSYNRNYFYPHRGYHHSFHHPYHPYGYYY
jgi:outer membrane lipoprotein